MERTKLLRRSMEFGPFLLLVQEGQRGQHAGPKQLEVKQVNHLNQLVPRVAKGQDILETLREFGECSETFGIFFPFANLLIPSGN